MDLREFNYENDKDIKIGDPIIFEYNYEIRDGIVDELLVEGYRVKTLHGVFYIAKEDVING